MIMIERRYMVMLFFFAVALISKGPQFTYAGENSFTQKDRELLVRLDERLNQIDKRFEQIDKRFEQMDKRFAEFQHYVDKRFEQMDKRFETFQASMERRFEIYQTSVDKRFEQIDKRLNTLENLMIAIVAAFASIVAVTIGFAIWDRRTMARKARDEAIEQIEKEGRLGDFIRALRAYAKKNREFADILRSFNLL